MGYDFPLNISSLLATIESSGGVSSFLQDVNSKALKERRINNAAND
jgi:hypothetical protein